MKRYNTPHRHRVIKTRLTEEEYAEFSERVTLCKMSQSEYMRKVSYLPLWHLLLERGMTKSQMRIEAGLTTNVLANMNKGQHISMDSLIRICDALDCNLNDVVELVKTEE